jgi:hypothetical protein
MTCIAFQYTAHFLNFSEKPWNSTFLIHELKLLELKLKRKIIWNLCHTGVIRVADLLGFRVKG